MTSFIFGVVSGQLRVTPPKWAEPLAVSDIQVTFVSCTIIGINFCVVVTWRFLNVIWCPYGELSLFLHSNEKRDK